MAHRDCAATGAAHQSTQSMLNSQEQKLLEMAHRSVEAHRSANPVLVQQSKALWIGSQGKALPGEGSQKVTAPCDSSQEPPPYASPTKHTASRNGTQGEGSACETYKSTLSVLDRQKQKLLRHGTQKVELRQRCDKTQVVAKFAGRPSRAGRLHHQNRCETWEVAEAGREGCCETSLAARPRRIEQRTHNRPNQVT